MHSLLLLVCVASSAYGANLNWIPENDQINPVLIGPDDPSDWEVHSNSQDQSIELIEEESQEGDTSELFAEDDPKAIQFFLHTQDNPEDPQELVENNSTSVDESNFDTEKLTMILVHGFMESSNFDSIVTFRQEYLNAYNHNVIVVNYKMYKPSDGDIYEFYQHVGQVVCSFIRYLIEEFGLDPNETHIIGHSVGVHVSGEAGKCLKNTHKIKRITGLDPANWQDLGQSPMDLIRPADAETVDCLHTSLSFGIHSPICQCNFYPNGGSKQPECEDANEIGQLIGLCDHLSAFRYYQRTFLKPQLYPAYKCETLNGTTLGGCSGAIAGYLGTNEDLYCGDSRLFNVPFIKVPN